jgi:hypothetical protein
VTGLRYQDLLKDAGFEFEVIKNQGKGQPCSASRRCGVSSPKCSSTKRRARLALIA